MYVGKFSGGYVEDGETTEMLNPGEGVVARISSTQTAIMQKLLNLQIDRLKIELATLEAKLDALIKDDNNE